MRLINKVNLTLPSSKEIYFCFCLYYSGAHDLEEFQSALNPTVKKLFLITILVVTDFFL